MINQRFTHREIIYIKLTFQPWQMLIYQLIVAYQLYTIPSELYNIIGFQGPWVAAAGDLGEKECYIFDSKRLRQRTSNNDDYRRSMPFIAHRQTNENE